MTQILCFITQVRECIVRVCCEDKRRKREKDFAAFDPCTDLGYLAFAENLRQEDNAQKSNLVCLILILLFSAVLLLIAGYFISCL